MKNIIKTSIGKKIIMATSAIFLMIFLLQHFIINATSMFSINLFNSISHFMGTNPMVQFVLQPILLFGVILHFIMGFILEYQNNSARKYKYYKNIPSASWMSQNMILSGTIILLFLIIHFIDFWIPEIQYKYIDIVSGEPNRYFEELKHKFENPIRVGFYCFSFILLGLHLNHGFTSSLKSLGLKNNYINSFKILGKIYSIGIPVGFCIIAIYHFFNI